MVVRVRREGKSSSGLESRVISSCIERGPPIAVAERAAGLAVACSLSDVGWESACPPVNCPPRNDDTTTSHHGFIFVAFLVPVPVPVAAAAVAAATSAVSHAWFDCFARANAWTETASHYTWLASLP